MGIAAGLCPFTPSCVQRFLISGSDLGIDARFSPETSFCLHRFLISGPNLRIAAGTPSRMPSLLQCRMARLPSHPSGPPRTAPRNTTPHGSPQLHPARPSPAQQGRALRHHARKPLGLLPGRFYQKTILFMNGVWWAYGMKAREGSGSVIIREACFPGVIEPRVSSTPMA